MGRHSSFTATSLTGARVASLILPLLVRAWDAVTVDTPAAEATSRSVTLRTGRPSGCYLSFLEREDIAVLKAQGVGVRQIARSVGRNPSTISRELRRNAATRGGKLEYRALVGQWKSEVLSQRPKAAKLVADERLYQYAQDRLSGSVRTPDGLQILGPEAPEWKGRNKPHRGDRQWVTAWSPEQISN